MEKRASAKRVAFRYLLAKKKKRKKKRKLKRTTKKVKDLEVNEFTAPHKGGRYRAISVGRDENGYFVMTHRARSKSHEAPKDIPESDIRFIRSTG